MTCPNCGCEDHEFLLIDCRLPLGSVERETIRYCFSCRPSARHPYANCLPQIIRKTAYRRLSGTRTSRKPRKRRHWLRGGTWLTDARATRLLKGFLISGYLRPQTGRVRSRRCYPRFDFPMPQAKLATRSSSRIIWLRTARVMPYGSFEGCFASRAGGEAIRHLLLATLRIKAGFMALSAPSAPSLDAESATPTIRLVSRILSASATPSVSNAKLIPA